MKDHSWILPEYKEGKIEAYMSNQIPMFQPPSEWLPPENIPDLDDAKEIAIDLETMDPDIKTKGPGWATGNGAIIGVAIAVEGWKGYFPLRHPGGGNFDEKIFFRKFKKMMALPNRKIFHNAMYDVGWLKHQDIPVNGTLIDTMIAAQIIDENRMGYSLNAVAKDYLGEKKSETLLYEAAKEWGVDPKGEMYKLPAQFVGPYAEQDAELTLKLWGRLESEIYKQDLVSIFSLETNILPALIEMKWRGVRIDTDRAAQIKEKLLQEENLLLSSIQNISGVSVDLWAARSIAKAFDSMDIPYEKTAKAKEPKFDKNFLGTHPSKLAKLVVQAREINKARTTFIDTIMKHQHKGRIHAEIHQMRSDQGGTVTGRFSMSNPNLQQIPARHEKIGPMIRSLFIPEEGSTWGCFDYNQQEPRLVAHYAAITRNGLDGADKVIDGYNNDLDFHGTVAEMANIDRKIAKTVNLGLFYGMGKGKLKSQLGLNDEQADELFKTYHSRVPFVKQLMDQASKSAQENGFVRTLLGRKCRFDLWEPASFGVHKPLPREQATREHGKNIKRAFTYKALNRLIQGSAADMTKKAILDLYKEGIVPHIQVHDELDCSFESEIQAKKIEKQMVECVDLKVPIKVDCEIGANWGEIK